MAGNSILTDSIIVKECLLALKNNLGFTKNVNRQYDDKFAVEGAKIGDTINLRKPSRYQVTSGATFVAQDSVDQSLPLVLDTQNHVGMAFSTKDLTLSVDNFRERYIENAVIALANKVDNDGLKLYQSVPNAVGVPVASTPPSTLKGFLQAKQKLAENGAPIDTYSAILNPASEAAMVNGLSGLFQSAEKIAEQYEKGVMGMAAGCKFSMSQNVWNHTIGPLGGTPLMAGATVDGATTIVTDAWTSGNASRLKKGDVITIGSVYAVNPQTRQSTGALQQFVVTADCPDISGGITIPIYPAIQSTGQYQNVDSLPQDEAAILVFGAASTYQNVVVPSNMVFHKDAFVLGCADLMLPKGMHMAARASDPESGLSLRLVAGYDLVNDRMLSRLDILYGWKCVYPELACRVVGQPA